MPRPLEIKIYRNRRGSEVPSPRDGDFPVFDGQPIAYSVPMLASTKGAVPTLMIVDPKTVLPSGLISPAYLPIASNILRYCNIKLIATQTGGGAGTVGDSLATHGDLTLKRLVLPGTTVQVGATVPLSFVADAGAAAWVVAYSIDVVNGGLAITVTGEVNKSIDWIARVQVLDLRIA